MSDNLFAVIFRGDVVMGQSIVEVKQKLKKIFKADDARIDNLFGGKPVPLKRNLTEDQAQHYQQVLRQAGAVVVIESMAALAEAELSRETAAKPHRQTTAKSKPEPSPPPQTADKARPTETETETETGTGTGTETGEWQLAPVGSILSTAKKPVSTETDIDTDYLKIMPQEGNLVKDNERQAAPEATVDVETLEWELTPFGEALLKEAERQTVTAPEIDTSEMSVAEMSGNLVKESERKEVRAVDIDTGHLRLLPDDSE